MYSVAFLIKNGKKYYKNSRKKYHLKEKDAVLSEIPTANGVRKTFYYWNGTAWIFDEDAYTEYQAELEAAELETQQAAEEEISKEELLEAMLELAQGQSDLEDAMVELAGTIGGE